MSGSPDDARALFVAVDVHYTGESEARAAIVAADDDLFTRISWTDTTVVSVDAPYQPGLLYLRELPPLKAIIQGAGRLSLIVVDGYVDLDETGLPGLGAHVHAEFGVPVIGVAKTRYRTASHAAQVLRGRSARPLYVTAAGMPISDAARLVRDMTGRFRLPDALKLADRLSRGLEYPWVPDDSTQLRRAQWQSE